MDSNFIDYVKIYAKAGNGGPGSSNLRREKFIPKGGPDGGDGGNGGDIIIKGDMNLWTLLNYKYNRHFKAGNGKPGGKSRSTGANGESILLKVPLGTVIKNIKGEIINEIMDEKQTILLKGGKGGKGNWNFKSSTNRAPRYSQKGQLGKEMIFILELKILADVGIIGLPNVGKSTLLSKISNARPKIGNYPFTTIKPNLGIVKFYDYSFIVSDIPGLIKGAHMGKGLGLNFLRHIERNHILLLLISADSNDIISDYHTICKELYSYNEELKHKDIIIAISKSDLLDKIQINEIQIKFDYNIIFLSAFDYESIFLLKKELYRRLKIVK